MTHPFTKREVLVHKIQFYLLFIEVLLPSEECEWSCIYVRGNNVSSFYDISIGFYNCCKVVFFVFHFVSSLSQGHLLVISFAVFSGVCAVHFVITGTCIAGLLLGFCINISPLFLMKIGDNIWGRILYAECALAL